MRRPGMFASLACLVLTAACGGSGGGGGSQPPPSDSFVHVAEPGTLVGAGTQLSHPWLDDNPSALLVATHVLNPGGGAPMVRNPHPIGVRYVGVWGRWEIFNEDAAAMEAGAAFFVRILDAPRGFLHMAIPENSGANSTILSSAMIDGDPDAKLIVTQYAGAPDSPDYTENPGNIGVYYSAGTWKVFNQDTRRLMPLGAHFFVQAELLGRLAYTHDVDLASIPLARTHWTYLQHPSLDGNPLVHLHVTSNWNPGGEPGIYNDHPVAVLYDDVAGLWAIENVDGEPMPVGSNFNVWIH